MTDQNPTVPVESKETQVAADAATQVSVGVTEKATPDNATGDANGVKDDPAVLAKKLEEAQKAADKAAADLKATQAKYEQDINQMKASLQKDADKRVKEAQDRLAAMQKTVDELATQGMDEKQKAEYERNQALKENENLRQALEAERARNQSSQEYQDTLTMLTTQYKIPADKLKTGGSVEELTLSAWNYLYELSNGAAATPAEPEKPVPDTTKAPDVLTDGAAAKSKQSMADFLKAHAIEGEHPMATRMRVNDMIAAGELAPESLPLSDA